MSSFLEELRAALRARAPAPGEVHGALVHVMTAAGEYARATAMPVEEFVAMALQAYAESHDKVVTHCEVVEDPETQSGTSPGADILIGMTIRWAKN